MTHEAEFLSRWTIASYSLLYEHGSRALWWRRRYQAGTPDAVDSDERTVEGASADECFQKAIAREAEYDRLEPEWAEEAT